MSHSHTQGMALNSNSSRNLHLPDIHQHGPNLAFGINQRGLLDANSDLQNQAAFRNRNQSMTLELAGQNVGPDATGDDPSMQYLGKSKVDGMHSSRNRAKFNQSDIKRNASVAVVGHLGATPQANQRLASSRKNIFGKDAAKAAMASTAAQLANRDRVLERGAAELLGKGGAKKNAGSDFHKRNNSVVGSEMTPVGTGIGVEGQSLGGAAARAFRSTRPSLALPASHGPLKPKVSFAIPGTKR